MVSFIVRKSSQRSAALLLALTLATAALSGIVLIPRVEAGDAGRSVPDLSLLRSYADTRAFFDSVSSGRALADYRVFQAVSMVFPLLYSLSIAFIIGLGLKRCGLRAGPWKRLVLLPLAGGLLDYLENVLVFAIQALHPGEYRLLAAALSAATFLKFILIALGIVAMAVLAYLALQRDRGKRCLSTVRAPAAIGPYSQAVRSNGFVFLSGQLGMDPETGALARGVAAQAERALDNIQAILEDQGLTMADIVKTTIFLTDMADFQTVNEIYAGCFTGDFPARSTVQVAALPKGALVEIESVAKAG